MMTNYYLFGSFSFRQGMGHGGGWTERRRRQKRAAAGDGGGCGRGLLIWPDGYVLPGTDGRVVVIPREAKDGGRVDGTHIHTHTCLVWFYFSRLSFSFDTYLFS